jgi:predicted DNA binding protein
MVAGIPDGMDLILKRVGEYQPEMDDHAGQLTDRQKEILRTAIRMGYYDISLGASQRDLSTELGLSRGTIGEHLRRAEVKILQSVVV